MYKNKGIGRPRDMFHRILSTACHSNQTLDISKDLFDVDTRVGVVCGAGGSGIACFEGGLWKGAMVHTPFFNHHILRLTQSGVTPGFLELLF